MDINNIYVSLIPQQNDDNSVTCLWDFGNAGYVDSEGNEQILDKNKLALEALYIPDPDNPLIIRLPKEIQFEREDQISKLYKAKNCHFTIGEILEIVRNFIEKIYNEKYSDNKYVFNILYFEGLIGCGRNFEIRMELVEENIIGDFGEFQQLINMLEM